MDDLSTKPKLGSQVSAFVRSRRMRGLFLLLLSLCGLYYLFLSTTHHLGSSGREFGQGRVDMNGEGEPMDLTQDIPQAGGKASQVSPLEKRIQGLIDTNRVMVFSKSYCPYSAAAKKLLRSYTLDIQVLEVDFEVESANIKVVLTKLAHGHSTFPSIFFDGESIGGRDNLQMLEDEGHLKPRLQRLGLSLVR
ncbi:hypothetical protein EDD11_004804 [Mortierella claussenii]|nr:hypothetical protein EDD11_004804 [Mortierella claussenii]